MVPAPTLTTPADSAAPSSASPRRALGRTGRRAPLPTGRAVLGALLVTTAAVITFAAYTSTSSGPRQHVVVANHVLVPGQRLVTGDLRLAAVDVPADSATRLFSSTIELEGAVTIAPIDANGFVTRAAVLTADAHQDSSPASRELSFSLERDHALDGRLQRGEVIDLVATFGTGPDAFTAVVAHRINVIDVDSSATGVVGSAGRVTLLVALPSEHDVLRTSHALEVAKVTVVRATRADAGTDDPALGEYRLDSPTSRTTGTRTDGVDARSVDSATTSPERDRP